MRNLISSILIFLILFMNGPSMAQTTALEMNRNDCQGNPHSIFADLDAGKAVILEFYMDNCGACPPPAKKIQSMADHILITHPGKITAYAFPYTDATTCAESASWTLTNNLHLFFPMDSGAAAVAYYGGFGMPTVVLLGGTNHRVMFNTQNFLVSDTTIMRDSILALLGPGTLGMKEVKESLDHALTVFPNPASDHLYLNINVSSEQFMEAEICNAEGKRLSVILSENVNEGLTQRTYNISSYPAGNYFIRWSNRSEKIYTKPFSIIK